MKRILILAMALLGAVVLRAEDIYIDVTETTLRNPRFDTNDTREWYVEVANYNNGGYQGASYYNGDSYLRGFVEVWNSWTTLGDGVIYQELTLPKGRYRLHADGIAVWQHGGYREPMGVSLFASIDNDFYQSPMASGNGAPEHFVLDFEAKKDAEDVLVGIFIEGTNCNWVAADNFRLELNAKDAVLAKTIKVSGDDATLIVDEERRFEAVIEPKNATSKRVEWGSSNENVLKVDQDGTVTAVGAGTAEITASATDGSGVSGKIKLTVKESTVSAGELVVNEVMVMNIDQFVDTSWNYGDWIELYNPTDESISLMDCYITDDPENPMKHRLRKPGVIRAKGFKTIWFDHFSEELFPQQVDFKLDADGGWIALVSKDGKVLTAANYPAAMARTSWARKTDGGEEWGKTAQATPGASNNGSQFATEQLAAPVVDREGHIYTSAPTVRVTWPKGSTLRYTTDGSTPSATNGQTSTTGVFHIKDYGEWGVQTTLRLCAIQDGYLPSPVVTNSYIRREHDYSIPVMVISGTDENFFSDEMGALVEGTNGAWGGPNVKWNVYQDWDRPGVFEYFEPESGERLFCQEIGISAAGGWSRTWDCHTSFKIKASKHYGLNSMDYPFFDEKPYNKHKVLQIRNGGNDRGRFIDAAVQQLVGTSGIYVDYQGYQPVFHYINGRFGNVFNMREPNNKHHGYSNYGLDTDLMDQFELTSHPVGGNYYEQMEGTKDTLNLLLELSRQCEDPAVYKRICDELIDIDEYINYMAVEIWLGTGDWLTNTNNFKGYRSTEGDGRFHFVMLDKDSAFENGNMAGSIDNENNEGNTLWHNLLRNADFRKRFIDAYSLVCGSVFEPERCQEVVDRMFERVEPMMNAAGESARGSYGYVRDRISGWWNSNVLYNNTQGFWRLNEESRKPIDLSFESKGTKAKFTYNGMDVPTGKFKGRAFLPVTLVAGDVPGYVFKGWKISSGDTTSTVTVFDEGSDWKYYDQGSLDGKDWQAATYGESKWKQGMAPLGYSKDGIKTTLGYGGNSGNKYPTYYFRKSFTLDAAPTDDDTFTMQFIIDDGFIVYVNGEEAGRYNMPGGNVTFNTFATTYAPNNPDRGSIKLPSGLFKKGKNVIAVEVHNNSASSTDIMWEASLSQSTPVEGDSKQMSPERELKLAAGHNGAALRAIYEPLPENTLPVRINELSAGNTVNVNDYFKKDDWLELYNTTDEPIDVAGMYLSDDAKNPQKFQIPANDVQQTVIQPHSQLVVWASKRTSKGRQIHANFKLANADGEQVMLTSEDGSWSDRMEYVAHSGKESVGAYPDGTNNVYKMHRPTIGADNTLTSYAQYLYANTIEPVEQPELFVLDLNEGWNWISHPLASNIAITEMTDAAQRILSQTAEASNIDGKGWTGGLTSLVHGLGYKVQMSADKAYSFSGRLCDPAGGVYLHSGWNWVGYPLLGSQSLSAAIPQPSAAEGDMIVGRSGFATFEGGQWSGSLETLKEGEGYIYKSSVPKSLTFTSSAVAAAPRFRVQPRTPWTTAESNYPDVMGLVAVAQRDGAMCAEGAFSIGAFSQDGECRGIGRYIDGRLFLTVYGNDGEKISFLASDPETGIIYEVDESFTFASDVLGTRTQPVALHIGAPTDIARIEGNGAIRSVAFYSLSGAYAGSGKAGLSSGLYIMKCTMHDGTCITRKMLVK